MNLKQLTRTLSVLAVLSVGSAALFAQTTRNEFWIRFMDSAAGSDTTTMYFACDSFATWGLDSLNPTLKETEGPPLSPGFDVRWINPPRHASPFYGAGLLKYLLIPARYDGVPDTMRVKFVNNDSVLTAVWTLNWMDPSYISARCDSLVMRYFDPDLAVTVRLNMATRNNIQFGPSQTGSGLTQIDIFKYGNRFIDAVRLEDVTIPTGFALQQNYPNPFNPTTTMHFDIQKQAFADIAVFNILGQKVATLVSQELAAGSYSATWNGLTDGGQAVGSGVYYVRMTARSAENGAEQFSALRKLLLMK